MVSRTLCAKEEERTGNIRDGYVDPMNGRVRSKAFKKSLQGNMPPWHSFIFGNIQCIRCKQYRGLLSPYCHGRQNGQQAAENPLCEAKELH